MELAFVDKSCRRLSAGWLLLALSAIALSTLCAVLLIAARAPLPGLFADAGELFKRALVLHVTFAVVVWFLACAAGFWTMAAGAAAGVFGWSALALAGVGLGAMLAPLFSHAAQPVLANYVPVLDHPVFLAGLSLFVLGIAACGAMSLRGMLARPASGGMPAWRLGALLSVLSAAGAIAALIASLAAVGMPATPGDFEALAWGPGHVLQFVHVLLLMSVWSVLGERVLGNAVAPQRWLTALLLLAAVPILAAPYVYLNYPVGSTGFRRGFTLLMTWGCWPAAALLGLQILLRLKRAGRQAWNAPQAQALVLSILLFLLGCVLGAMIRSDSTMVPAHYHGTVGAVTLAYMALAYRLLPVFGAGEGSSVWERRQPLLYGAGLAILALALAWSGWLGVPRKTLHADVIMQYPAYFIAMALVGIGGLLAVGASALFVMNVIGRLRLARQVAAPRSGARRDIRMPALALTLVLTILIGMMITYWQDDMGRPTGAAMGSIGDPGAHVAQKRKEEISRKFAEGAALLNAQEYQAAASALHRVLELAPQMPEAHVNMGFVMIGLQKYAMARDFFEAAINLRTAQMNAYYGLGVALDGLGDVAGALGAMRAYVHLSNPGDPFVQRANAAIREWESELAKSRMENPPDTAGIPESKKSVARYPIPEKKFD